MTPDDPRTTRAHPGVEAPHLGLFCLGAMFTVLCGVIVVGWIEHNVGVFVMGVFFAAAVCCSAWGIAHAEDR